MMKLLNIVHVRSGMITMSLMRWNIYKWKSACTEVNRFHANAGNNAHVTYSVPPIQFSG
jgi:hypothetical protein